MIPDEIRECNAIERLCVPNVVSYLAFHTPDAEIKGLKEFPRELRPPVMPTFLSFRVMVGLGTFMALASLLAVILCHWGRLEDRNGSFGSCSVDPALTLPRNWLIVAEVGRQPDRGVLKTSDAVQIHQHRSGLGVAVGFTYFRVWDPGHLS
jgi:cytochrome d ubiquinol oxidase subunit I